MKKYTEKNTESGLENRPELLSTANQRQIDFRRRKANPSLDTGKLLDLMQSNAPSFFQQGQVVGKWVWIQFADRQPAGVTRVLAELDFHWNRVRKAWQHPYGIYQAGDIRPAQALRQLFCLHSESCLRGVFL